MAPMAPIDDTALKVMKKQKLPFSNSVIHFQATSFPIKGRIWACSECGKYYSVEKRLQPIKLN